MILLVLYFDYNFDVVISDFVFSLQDFIDMVVSPNKNVVAVYDYILAKGWATSPKLYDCLMDTVNYEKVYGIEHDKTRS